MGVESERTSRLLEDIIRVNAKSEDPMGLISKSRINKYLPDPVDYKVESQVNARLNLSILQLLRVLESNVYYGYNNNNWIHIGMKKAFRIDAATKEEKERGVRYVAPSQGGQKRKAPTMSTPARYVMKEWDKMMVAKYFPG